MTPYERPSMPEAVFVDDEGRPYGDRWGHHSPPGETYSVTSHLERFAPLHEVTDALIGYLTQTYDVEVTESLGVGSDFVHERGDIVRAVRVTPTAPDAAALTFAYTSFPSVVVHAGELVDMPFPSCGCDACDETWQQQAEELEWNVLAVAAGGFSEAVTGQNPPWTRATLITSSGRSSSGGEASALDPDRLERARKRLEALPGGNWAAWTPVD